MICCLLVKHVPRQRSQHVLRESRQSGDWRLDTWCKDCVHAFVKDKETMQEYCRHNNREFNDELWEKCEQLAISDLDTGKVSGFKSESARNNYITRRAITDYFKQMNMVRWYKYDGETSGEQIPFMSSPIEEVQEWFDPDEEVYSDFWEGSYTRSELDRLNAMFKNTKTTLIFQTFTPAICSRRL